jgi:hypothetical protein
MPAWPALSEEFLLGSNLCRQNMTILLKRVFLGLCAVKSDLSNHTTC